MVVLFRITVRFLDTAAGRGIEPGHRQPDGGTVRKITRFLYQAFAKGAAADDHATVVVLDGAGENLAGRGAGLIDQHGEGDIPEQTLSISGVILTFVMESFQVYDFIAAVEEEIGEQEGLVEITAGIVPQIKDEARHPLPQQFQGGHADFLEGRTGEFGQADVTGRIIDHERGVHAMDRNLSAGDFKLRIFPIATDRHIDFRPGRTFQPTHHAVLRKLDARDDFVIHLDEPVTRLKPDFLGRAAGNDFQHDGRIIRDIELDADTVEIPGQLGFGLFELYRGKINGMRIQLGQSRHDGRIGHALDIDGIDIVLLDLIQDQVEFLPVGIPCPDTSRLAAPDQEQRQQ